jgi:hypothetical protein
MAKGPSFDTNNLSILADVAEIVSRQPQRPRITLWYEFVELLDCHTTFALDNQAS